MSRGLGRLQRFILDEVAKLPPPADQAWPFTEMVAVIQIAERFACGEPTDSQMVSTRRAVRRLAEAGLVDSRLVEVRPRGRGSRFWVRGVRAPLTADEVAAHDAALAAAEFKSSWVYGALHRTGLHEPLKCSVRDSSKPRNTYHSAGSKCSTGSPRSHRRTLTGGVS